MNTTNAIELAVVLIAAYGIIFYPLIKKAIKAL